MHTGDRSTTLLPWLPRARRRGGPLALAAAVVAAASTVAVLVAVLGPAAATARGSTIADRAAARAAVAVAVALDGLALAVLVTLTLVALVVVLARIDEQRAAEDGLLVARGATRAQLGRWGAVEGAVVGAVGAVVGALTASGVLAARGAGAGELLAAGLPAVITFATAVLASALVAAVVAVRRRVERSGVLAQSVLAAVLVVAAVFATWRTFASGVPVRAEADGVAVDLLAAAAPVVWLLAGAAVVLLAGGVLARAVARGAGARRGLLPAYTARRTARTWSTAAPVVLATAVVAGIGVVVAGFGATVARVDEAAATAVVGPDVRVRIDGDGQLSDQSPARRPDRLTNEAADTTPVWTDTVDVGTVRAPIVAVPGARARNALPGGAGAAVERVRSGSDAGVRLAPGARTVSVDASTATASLDGVPRTDAVGAVSLDAWLVDGQGTPALVRMRADGTSDGSVPVGGAARVTGQLPTAGTPWRLLAVEPSLTFSVRPPEVDAGMSAAALQVAVDVSVRGADGDVSARTTAVDLAPPSRAVLGRAPGDGPLPVVLTTELARRLGLHTGSELDVTPSATSSPLRSVVRAVVPTVPGAASRSAIAADLDAVVAASIDGGAAPAGAAVPRVDEQWITTADPARTAADLRAGLPDDSTVTTAADVRARPVIDTALTALVAVAITGATFVTLALVLAVAGPDPSRRVLRASGVPARSSALARAIGLAGVAATGIVGGTMTGIVAVAVCVAPFALAAVPSAIGLVDATPVAAPPTAWVVPALLGALALVVSGSVLLRALRAEPTS